MHYTHEMMKKHTDRYGKINLSGSSVTSLPENLNVEGSLDLGNTPISSLPENLKIGGNLWLDHTFIAELPENLIVGGSLYLSNTSIISLPENLIVGGNLYLSNTPIAALPENLIVGGSLYLSKTSIVSLPECLTVGCDLNLYNTPIKSLPENLKIGGNLYHNYLILSNNHRLHNGDYIPNEYIYADNILTFIKRDKKIGEYTYYIGELPNKNIISDGTFYVICKNYESGVKEIKYRRMKYRGESYYRLLYTNNDLVSKDDMINIYRSIIERRGAPFDFKRRPDKIAQYVVHTVMPDVDQCTLKEFIQHAREYQSTHGSLDGFDTFVSAI